MLFCSRFVLVGVLAGSALLAACSPGGGSSASSPPAAQASGAGPDDAARSAAAAAAQPAPADVTLVITAPKEGASVPAGTVSVTYDLSSVTLVAPNQASKIDDYQVGALLDVDATPYLQLFKPLPSGDDRIVLTGAKSVTFNNVAAGSHTVTVMLATSDHVSVSPPKFYKVTFQAT
ncbi:MAG TPA: hypothetical protein VKU60_10965 [Chloroflexota bacterium]|nr:hypothetical protein [Chloroflexota bacterium]